MACGPGCDCRCCAGIDAETPVRLFNSPGLPQIAYRMGRHAAFLESLTARVSSADYPALSELTTREPSDATMALFDALASSLDVLTFYTERYANENYLRTATERLSVLEMARLIGYAPAPGVAASTHLAFTLQAVPGNAQGPITIPVGTKVQSVPGQDETAQLFETVEPARARAAWNAVPAQLTVPWAPKPGDTELWLEGVATGLETGDAILIAGQERKASTGSDAWAVRVLSEVAPDNENERTRVAWADALGSVTPQSGLEVHALRQRAGLFGNSAPDPNLFSNESNINNKINSSGTYWSWKHFSIGSRIDIDPQNEKVVAGSWVALVSNQPGSGLADLPGQIELYRADKTVHRSRQDFALSGKITRVTPDTTANLSIFGLRRTLVLAQSERLEHAATPLFHPVHGDAVTLGQRVEGLVPGQPIALSGKRQPVAIVSGTTNLSLLLDDGEKRQLQEGDRLFMLEPAVQLVLGPTSPFGIPHGFGVTVEDLLPTLPAIGLAIVTSKSLSAEEFAGALGSSALLVLKLLDRDGVEGTLLVSAENIALAESEDEDPTVREIAFISSQIDAITLERDLTRLKLHDTLEHVYERATLRVNANVAPATHGETVEAILGDGDGRQANQSFKLNQAPLTYVSAGTSSGRASTLEVRVNDVLWSEGPTLYQADPDARAHQTYLTDDGFTTIQFGDGVEGARLPSGATNVRARYRKGLGVAGNVASGKITTLLSRPLGVSEAVNPSDATGGEDSETLERARDNAPLTTLTLNRAVSILDYANFARAFAGIDKAHALWIPSGAARGVFLTIAGVEGAEVPEASKTFANLGDALATYGDPLVPLRMINYRDSRIRIRASVKVLGDYDSGLVLPKLEDALRERFAFSSRAFGQTVSVDEVAAAAQNVAGVAAVHVTKLYRDGEAATLAPRIFARLPVATLNGLPAPAELLTLSDEPVELDELP